jgi:hypothetical protein
MRAVWTWTAPRIWKRRRRAHSAGRAGPRALLDRARLAEMVARIDKPAFTRADLVELVGALLPVDVPADPRALIEQIVEVVVEPGTPHRRGSERVDQVRNGNRWRVVGIDAAQGRITGERLTDAARVTFEGDYRREHLTLGYAGTVHSAQGMTIGNATTPGICWTILSDRATRAMAYVGMTRGRDENHLALYPAVTNEAHAHQSEDTGIHQMRRGTKGAVAHALHTLLTANDDRARTMHTVAARTDRQLLPTVVAALLNRNDQRRADRAQAWRQHSAQTRAREAAFEHFTANAQRARRHRSRGQHRSYGLEL